MGDKRKKSDGPHGPSLHRMKLMIFLLITVFILGPRKLNNLGKELRTV